MEYLLTKWERSQFLFILVRQTHGRNYQRPRRSLYISLQRQKGALPAAHLVPAMGLLLCQSKSTLTSQNLQCLTPFFTLWCSAGPIPNVNYLLVPPRILLIWKSFHSLLHGLGFFQSPERPYWFEFWHFILLRSNRSHYLKILLAFQQDHPCA